MIRLVGPVGHLGTQDVAGFLKVVGEFMNETNAFRDGAIIEAKAEHHHLEEWRTGMPGAMLEGRMLAWQEILDILA